MESFMKRIAIEGDSAPVFYFNSVDTTTGIRYYISVVDEDGHTHVFTMEQDGSSWKITNAARLPDWIMNIQKKLEDAIIEHTGK